MIFSSEPTDWFDLQNKVAQIFNEIGCIVEEEKAIVTTRGSVNVDVYVQDIIKSPSLTYICECKHWESSIPKSIVHSFRTVIADYGAHVGYMISKKGYQSGAYEAAAWTNIILLTWNEFQELFFDAWYAGMWKRVHAVSAPILEFLSSSLFGQVADIIDPNKKVTALIRVPEHPDQSVADTVIEAKARNLYYGMFHKFSAYGEASNYPENLIEKTPLPMTIVDPRRDAPSGYSKIEVSTYREYFEILLSAADYALEVIKIFALIYRIDVNIFNNPRESIKYFIAKHGSKPSHDLIYDLGALSRLYRSGTSRLLISMANQ